LEFYFLGNPKFGVKVYKNTIPKDSNIPMRLHASLDDSEHEYFRWHDSLVGEGTKMPDYRDCTDFKMDKSFIDKTPKEFSDIIDIYEIVATAQNNCLKEYQSQYNVTMNYMESINFVKYTPNQHFAVHTDHGFSYVCTISCVTYLNDEYDGGELYFPHLDIEWKPEFGDSIFFPSTFLYAHASKPVSSGVKYSAVTMFDYNEDTHKYGGFTRDFAANNENLYLNNKLENTEIQKNISTNNNSAVIDEEYLRNFIQKEIQSYAMESWKQWQDNNGDMSNMGNYQKYVAGKL
jgi:predicted 2-oxoglutarate/Fe(II)-dependent dioxygenase YbiX